jgi:5-methylthioadenosine/S-adenosylhomocysteine deaminase
MKKAITPKDLPDALEYGIKGRIVTMKSESDIFNEATLYVNAGAIQAIIKEGEAVPDSLKDVPVYDSGGTLFPGLIELHNHLSYNCLPYWPAPQKYSNRDQWSAIALYKTLISGPMNILGKTPGYVEAIVRYVECKCLVAGVTTSQGIMLFSNAGIRKYYQGIIRNVEDPNDHRLPKVDAHIPDIASKDASHFLKQLEKASCLLLHLSEGYDDSAHKHFESLQIDDDTWAITSALTGIHCVALKQADYVLMNKTGASMVWSPMSNFMLYGRTADIAAAKASGITIGLGSDWSPSGSKNLLGELKVAKLFSDYNGHIFSDYELISMATTNAAKIIRWDKSIGSLEVGKLADFLIVDGTSGDPYEQLLHASEKDLSLVVINGTPRYGSKSLMRNFGKGTETISIGKSVKVLNLAQPDANPVVGKVHLTEAARKLKKGLRDLKSVAKEMPLLKEVIGPHNTKFFVPEATGTKEKEQPSFVLVLDHNEEEGEDIRAHILSNHEPAVTDIQSKAVKPEDIPPIQLDALCVDRDKKYFKNIESAISVPDYIKTGLRALYDGIDVD